MAAFWRILRLLRAIKLLLTLGGLVTVFKDIVPVLIKVGLIMEEVEIELRKRCEESKRLT